MFGSGGKALQEVDWDRVKPSHVFNRILAMESSSRADKVVLDALRGMLQQPTPADILVLLLKTMHPLSLPRAFVKAKARKASSTKAGGGRTGSLSPAAAPRAGTVLFLAHCESRTVFPSLWTDPEDPEHLIDPALLFDLAHLRAQSAADAESGAEPATGIAMDSLNSVHSATAATEEQSALASIFLTPGSFFSTLHGLLQRDASAMLPLLDRSTGDEAAAPGPALDAHDVTALVTARDGHYNEHERREQGAASRAPPAAAAAAAVAKAAGATGPAAAAVGAGVGHHWWPGSVQHAGFFTSMLPGETTEEVLATGPASDSAASGGASTSGSIGGSVVGLHANRLSFRGLPAPPRVGSAAPELAGGAVAEAAKAPETRAAEETAPAAAAVATAVASAGVAATAVLGPVEPPLHRRGRRGRRASLSDAPMTAREREKAHLVASVPVSVPDDHGTATGIDSPAAPSTSARVLQLVQRQKRLSKAPRRSIARQIHVALGGEFGASQLELPIREEPSREGDDEEEEEEDEMHVYALHANRLMTPSFSRSGLSGAIAISGLVGSPVEAPGVDWRGGNPGAIAGPASSVLGSLRWLPGAPKPTHWPRAVGERQKLRQRSLVHLPAPIDHPRPADWAVLAPGNGGEIVRCPPDLSSCIAKAMATGEPVVGFGLLPATFATPGRAVDLAAAPRDRSEQVDRSETAPLPATPVQAPPRGSGGGMGDSSPAGLPPSPPPRPGRSEHAPALPVVPPRSDKPPKRAGRHLRDAGSLPGSPGSPAGSSLGTSGGTHDFGAPFNSASFNGGPGVAGGGGGSAGSPPDQAAAMPDCDLGPAGWFIATPIVEASSAVPLGVSVAWCSGPVAAPPPSWDPSARRHMAPSEPRPPAEPTQVPKTSNAPPLGEGGDGGRSSRSREAFVALASNEDVEAAERPLSHTDNARQRRRLSKNKSEIVLDASSKSAARLVPLASPAAAASAVVAQPSAQAPSKLTATPFTPAAVLQLQVLNEHAARSIRYIGSRLAGAAGRLRQARLLRLLSAIGSRSTLRQVMGAITEAAYELVRAERVSVFLIDQARSEQVIIVSEDQGAVGLRIPLGAGISGRVATSCAALNIPDAYAHADFDRSIDRKTGFRTRSVLCVPIVSPATEEALGVIQAINHQPDPHTPFDADDEEILQAVATSAGIALHKAETLAKARRDQERAAAMARVVGALRAADATDRGATSKLQDMLNQVLQDCLPGLVAAEHVSIHLVNEVEGHLELFAHAFSAGVRKRMDATAGAPGEVEAQSGIAPSSGRSRHSLASGVLAVDSQLSLSPSCASRGSTGTDGGPKPALASVSSSRLRRQTMGPIGGGRRQRRVSMVMRMRWRRQNQQAFGFVVPLGRGIVGTTASTRQAISTADASAHPAYSDKADDPILATLRAEGGMTLVRGTAHGASDTADAVRLESKSVLAVPVFVSGGNRVLAVLRVVNAEQRDGAPGFGDKDTAALEQLARELSGVLQEMATSRVFAGGAGTSADDEQEVAKRSMLAQYTTNAEAHRALMAAVRKATADTTAGGSPSVAHSGTRKSTLKAQLGLELPSSPTDAAAAAAGSGASSGDSGGGGGGGSAVPLGHSRRASVAQGPLAAITGKAVASSTMLSPRLAAMGSRVAEFSMGAAAAASLSPAARSAAAEGPHDLAELPDRVVIGMSDEEEQDFAGRFDLAVQYMLRMQPPRDPATIRAGDPPPRPGIDLTREEREERLTKMRTLHFNVMEYDREQLVDCMVDMVESLDLLEQCGVDGPALRRFLTLVSCLYRPNPFHNWTHAASVFHICFVVAATSRQSKLVLQPIDRLALLVGAACHDVDHPGVNNSFESLRNSRLALRYNDTSILENHHAATMFACLRVPEADFTVGIPGLLRRRFRKVAVAAIMDTDMQRHEEKVKAADRLPDNPDDEAILRVLPRGEDEGLTSSMDLCRLVLHTADLCNVALPDFEVVRRWSDGIRAEFSKQAEMETAMGASPAPFMCNLDKLWIHANGQAGFAKYVASKLWRRMGSFIDVLAPAVQFLDRNVQQWERVHEQASAQFEAEQMMLAASDSDEDEDGDEDEDEGAAAET